MSARDNMNATGMAMVAEIASLAVAGRIWDHPRGLDELRDYISELDLYKCDLESAFEAMAKIETAFQLMTESERRKVIGNVFSEALVNSSNRHLTKLELSLGLQ